MKPSRLFLFSLIVPFPVDGFLSHPPLKNLLFPPHQSLYFNRNKNILNAQKATSNRPTTIKNQTLSISSLPYNWKDQWYALTFEDHIPTKSAEPTPAAVFGHRLVLWRSGNETGDNIGTISCADDICPHRSSALSEGRVRDCNLECLYHGWQYEGSKGAAVFIPQLESGARIPRRACLKMRQVEIVEGIVWVWMGDGEVTKSPPESNDSIFEDKTYVNDFQIDLPYDHAYLVENLTDPAHIPVSHDRTQGGGMRENAMPYVMEIDEESISSDGFTGRYRATRPNVKKGTPEKETKNNKSEQKEEFTVTEMTFEAPGIVRYRVKNGKLSVGAALHCMPVGFGRCRLLFRTYIKEVPPLLLFAVSLKPKFLQNLNSCKVLEQDVGLITTQEDHFVGTKRNLKDDYLLIDSSDKFVLTYRKWLDTVGDGMPWFQGLSRISEGANDSNSMSSQHSHLSPSLDPANHRASGISETRYHRHVIHSPVMRSALRRVRMAKRSFFTGAIVALMWTFMSLTMILSKSGGKNIVSTLFMQKLLPWWSVGTCLFSAAGCGMHFLEQRFYVSFNRRKSLFKESRI